MGATLASGIPSYSALPISQIFDHYGEVNWKEIRKQFPLKHHRVYLNNGTIGPSPTPVLEAIQTKMQELNAIGEYRGQEDSRNPIAELIGAAASEISMTHNTTEGINIVAAGLPLSRGDEVIMTSHEHAGNALPWLNQIKNKGIVIKVAEPARTVVENLDRINRLITDKTRVIAVPHISCTTGLKYPIKELSKLAKDKGLWMFVDGAHGPGSMEIDVKDLGCDFYASCGHKWLLGPAGTGFLYVNQDLLEDLTPQAIGAYSDTGWEISSDRVALDGLVDTAHRFDYGTQSAPLANGLKEAVNFLTSIGMKNIQDRVTDLSERLYEGLKQAKVELLSATEKESRSTMTTFKMPSMNYRDFGKEVSKEFRIRLVPESKLDAIRISTHIYNNENEIDAFIERVKLLVN